MQTKNGLSPEEYRAACEHRDALIDIRWLQATAHGRRLFKYLLKSLDAAQVPEMHLEGQRLFERIGFLRAGNSIFKLTAEANPKLAGELIAEIEKERYDELYGEQDIDGHRDADQNT
jgi:hypothetical protein